MRVRVRVQVDGSPVCVRTGTPPVGLRVTVSRWRPDSGSGRGGSVHVWTRGAGRGARAAPEGAGG